MARRATTLIREAFEKWDKDGNGTISKEELAGVLQQLGDFKPQDVERIMVEADKNGNGIIEYVEFVDWLLRPVRRLGAAALLSTSQLCLRADATTLGSPVKPIDSGQARWEFAEGVRPVRLQTAVSLQREHTITIWVLAGAPACGQWVQLVGDTRDGWGFSVGISASGALGICDPRLGTEKCIEMRGSLEPGKWSMLTIRGICETVAASSTGCTEFLVASDEEAVRFLGSAEAVGSGLVIGEFGCVRGGITAIASLVVWAKLLSDEELRELFLWDAVRFGCVSESTAAWLRLNRRRAPARSVEEEETVTRRLAAASAGKSEGLLDLSELKVVDADLPRVLEAVEESLDGVTALVLAENYITEDGVANHLVPFVVRLNTTFRIDIRGNEDINADAEGPLLNALASLPAHLGLRIDARGTRLGGEAILQLLNQSDRATEAVLAAAQERKRTSTMCADFEAKQPDLLSRWAPEVDSLALPSAHHNVATAQAPFQKFPVGDTQKLKELRAYLAAACWQIYDRKDGEHFSWSGDQPGFCGTGQLLAHFSYLSCAVTPRGHNDFGLRVRRKGELLATKFVGYGEVGLHSVVENGVVGITAVSGKSYGHNALTLRLQNLSEVSLCVTVPAGTIFQHISWIHRQNLLVGRTAHFHLQPGECSEKKLGAFCMNMSCACAAGDPMQLTALFFEDSQTLNSQGKVWDYFEGLFRRYREEAGVPDNAKGGKAKKKVKGNRKG